MASLEGGEELEQAWYDEAERRLASLESGEAADIPADEVFQALGLEPPR